MHKTGPAFRARRRIASSNILQTFDNRSLSTTVLKQERAHLHNTIILLTANDMLFRNFLRIEAIESLHFYPLFYRGDEV